MNGQPWNNSASVGATLLWLKEGILHVPNRAYATGFSRCNNPFNDLRRLAAVLPSIGYLESVKGTVGMAN